MSSLSYTEIQSGDFFKLNGIVYETIETTFSKKSRQKGSNKVKMKNLKNGSVITKTLHASDTLESVDIEKEWYTFVYTKGTEIIVHPEGIPNERVSISAGGLNGVHLIPQGERITAIIVDEEVLSIKFPVKVVLEVNVAPPSIRGNTAQSGNKQVVVETGATIVTPLFIEAGDKIKVNVETGEYVERFKGLFFKNEK